MAQSIRISDQFYDLADAARSVSGRSLAQQLEYWARLGAALDAAGVTTEQAMQMLGGDLDLKARVIQIVCQSVDSVDLTDVGAQIAQRHRQDEAAVSAGKRSAQSLAVIPRALVKKASFTFPSETKPKGGW
jgi:hypothetical protein